MHSRMTAAARCLTLAALLVVASLTGAMPLWPVFALCGADAPQSLADSVHAAWVAFIRDGAADWPRYDTDTRTTRVFGGGHDGVVDDPHSDRRRLWADVR